MKDAHKRLKFIRELRGYRTAAEAARAFGWKANTYKSYENEIRKITADAAQQFAQAFRVPAGWLLYGEGNYDNALSLDVKTALAFQRLPLLDWAVVKRTANISEAVRTATLRAVTAPDKNFGPLAFALPIEDESMRDPAVPRDNAFSPGDELVFDPEKEPHPGDYVLARVHARNATVFRQYRESGYTESGSKIVTLHALNPSYADENIVLGENGDIIARLIRHSRDYS